MAICQVKVNVAERERCKFSTNFVSLTIFYVHFLNNWYF